jgi:plastocyanin
MSILGRQISTRKVALAALLMFVLVSALAAAMVPAPAREITLVTRNMAFYLEDDPQTPNPPIHVRPGERVRIVLRNDDRGYMHDFAVPALGAAVDLIGWNRSAQVTLTVPDTPGAYDYVCQPHSLMMRGRFLVGE